MRRGRVMPPRCASYLTTVDDPGLPIMERHMKVLIYTLLRTCRYGPGPCLRRQNLSGGFEKQQAEEQAITDPVEQGSPITSGGIPTKEAAAGHRRKGIRAGAKSGQAAAVRRRYGE